MALLAGALLAVMIDWNSQLASFSSPLFASWTAHGVGAAASLFCVLLAGGRTEAPSAAPPVERHWPVWSYLGGIPGAFTVLLAAITVNSPLGLTGTLALVLIGQMLFGVAADHFGLFRLTRRRAGARDMGALALVLGGSIALLAARG